MCRMQVPVWTSLPGAVPLQTVRTAMWGAAGSSSSSTNLLLLQRQSCKHLRNHPSQQTGASLRAAACQGQSRWGVPLPEPTRCRCGTG